MIKWVILAIVALYGLAFLWHFLMVWILTVK